MLPRSDPPILVVRLGADLFEIPVRGSRFNRLDRAGIVAVLAAGHRALTKPTIGERRLEMLRELDPKSSLAAMLVNAVTGLDIHDWALVPINGRVSRAAAFLAGWRLRCPSRVARGPDLCHICGAQLFGNCARNGGPHGT